MYSIFIIKMIGVLPIVSLISNIKLDEKGPGDESTTGAATCFTNGFYPLSGTEF